MRTSAARGVAVALAVGAGLHLAAFPRHLEEGALVAAFFVITAVAQLGAAILLRRGTGARGQAVILLGNAALIVLWAASRSVGVPFGGHGGAPEAVALLDLLAVFAEASVIVGLIVRPADQSSVSSAPAWPVVTLTALLVFGVGVQVPSAHSHQVDPSSSPPRVTPAHGHSHSHPAALRP